MISGLGLCVMKEVEAVAEDVESDESDKCSGGGFLNQGLFLRHINDEDGDERVAINLFKREWLQ